MLDLPIAPALAPDLAAAVQADFERFADGLPTDLRGHVLERYGVDLAGEYAGRAIDCPFGKASGQLSLNIKQVERDANAGLGFVALKTVIAQDETGSQAMHEWAIEETRMKVEQIIGPRTGREGWTVTWKGRGWYDTFEAYLQLVREAVPLGREHGMVVAPSVKYHLPTADEPGFREAEYRYTTNALLAVWREVGEGPMPLEKDFSPTLAGSDRSGQQAQILTWLRRVPELIRQEADGPLTLGLKVMNAMFEDAFQLEMLRAAIDQTPQVPDFLICFNRLFDPNREFEGKVGVAYGGPDLSERNLWQLEQLLTLGLQRPTPPISATGDILDGRMAAAYGLLGATSFQMHTLFQLPDSHFAGTMRNKSEKVLHHLVFHPESGLLPCLLWLRQERGLGDGGEPVGVLGLPALGGRLAAG